MDRAASAEMREAHVKSGGDPMFAPQLVSVLHHGGRPLAGRIRTGFEGAVRDAGLQEEITPHWMRHTCATWLMERDAKPWDAASFTGMTTKTLEDCYGHHRPSNRAKSRTEKFHRGRPNTAPHRRARPACRCQVRAFGGVGVEAQGAQS